MPSPTTLLASACAAFLCLAVVALRFGEVHHRFVPEDAHAELGIGGDALEREQVVI